MKKTLSILLGILPMMLTGCFPTRIVTVSPEPVVTGSYGTTYGATSTIVTVPRTNTVTTTTQVYSINDDISLHLDLQAVGAAFAQASSVKEFESLLNNSSYMISNLDLNRDGYIDYLRVLETLDSYRSTHVYLIQAVLGANMFQDVATIVVENPALASYHVEIIGAPYIYGANYIVQPIFLTRPCIFAHICRHGYAPWRSPWYWDYYPSYYRRPRPLYLNHYQAYVHTYMRNHRYCHEVYYPTSCHYRDYDRVCHDYSRNDYGVKYPERSFTSRTANMPAPGTSALDRATGASSSRVTNARDIRLMSDASKVTTTTSSSSRTATSSSSSRGTSSASSSSSRTTTAPATSSTSSSSTSSSSRGTSSASSSSSRTTTAPATSSTSSSSRGTSSASSSSSRTSSAPSSSRYSTTTSTVRSSGTQTTTRSSNYGSSSSSRSSMSSSSSSSRSSSSSSSRSSSSTSSSSSSSRTSSSSSRTSSSSSSRGR